MTVVYVLSIYLPVSHASFFNHYLSQCAVISIYCSECTYICVCGAYLHRDGRDDEVGQPSDSELKQQLPLQQVDNYGQTRLPLVRRPGFEGYGLLTTRMVLFRWCRHLIEEDRREKERTENESWVRE